MRQWFEVVSGPIFWKENVVEYLPGVWDGPTHEARDGVMVWARSRRDAVRAAVRRWQRNCPDPHRRFKRYGCCYPHQQRDDGRNPFAGIKVEPVSDGGSET
jgi:hypothetical protein